MSGRRWCNGLVTAARSMRLGQDLDPSRNVATVPEGCWATRPNAVGVLLALLELNLRSGRRPAAGTKGMLNSGYAPPVLLVLRDSHDGDRDGDRLWLERCR